MRRGGALLCPKTPDSCIFSGKFLTWQTATGGAEPRPYDAIKSKKELYLMQVQLLFLNHIIIPRLGGVDQVG